MKLIYLLLFVTLISCSTNKKETNYSSPYLGVDLEKEVDKKIPLIEEKRNSGVYGPEVKSKESFYKSKSKKIVGLFLYPAAYNSLSYLKIVDNLQKYKLLPSVYSGAGMGAIIAALLSKGLTPDHVEWKFFALLEDLKDKEHLSDEWKEVVFRFLKSEFANQRIEQLKHALILPIYDKKLGKIRYLSRGNLYNILVINIDLDEEGESPYLSPLIIGDLKVSRIFDKGVDKLAILNSLGKNLYFEKGNHFHIGLYGKLIGYSEMMSKDSKSNLKWFNFDLGKRNLDQADDLQKLIMSSVNKNSELLDELRMFIKEDKEKK